MAHQHIVSSARSLAAATHGGQIRAGQPMIEHLDEVAVLVREYGDDHQCVAYLQHILEADSSLAERLEAELGSVIASCVVLLTVPPGTDAKQGSRVVYAKLADVPADDERSAALVVKTAERLADLQTCYLAEDRGGLRKLRRDHRDFRAAVFRPGVADELWTQIAEIITP